MGIIISHYKDPYQPTSIMESKKGFFRGSVKPFFLFVTHLALCFPSLLGFQHHQVLMCPLSVPHVLVALVWGAAEWTWCRGFVVELVVLLAKSPFFIPYTVCKRIYIYMTCLYITIYVCICVYTRSIYTPCVKSCQTGYCFDCNQHLWIRSLRDSSVGKNDHLQVVKVD